MYRTSGRSGVSTRIGLAGRLVLATCLLGLASANAATVFQVTIGQLLDNSTFSGTLTIDTTTHGNSAVSAASITISAPDSVTCTTINFQEAAGSPGYLVDLNCTPGNTELRLVISSDAAGDLFGYTGGSINTSSSPVFSFYVSTADPVVSGKVSGNLPAPTTMKAFSPAFIAPGGTSALTFTLTNGNTSAITGLAFTDTLPPGLVVATPLSFGNTCGGAFTATAGSGSVSLTGGVLSASTNCTISVNVTAASASVYNNVSSTVTSANAFAGNAMTATLTCEDPLTITKAFGTGTIALNGSTSLTFTVGNPDTTTATGVAFTDTFPSGLVVSTPLGVTNTCGGTFTAVAGSNSVSLSGGTVTASGSCTVSVNVTGTVAGSLVNTTSTVTASNAPTGAAATASIFVVGDAYQVGYAANLPGNGSSGGQSVINITNTGSSDGNLCVNIYAFDPSEEMLGCCTCQVTPNGLSSLDVGPDLYSNTLTGANPTSAVIKLVATSGTGAACDPTSAGSAANPLASGLRAWFTTLHQLSGSTPTLGITENPFTISTLSAGELAHLNSFCAFVLSDGSGPGVCKGCAAGGLGAASAK
jgi:uncharacterized repeat protein (TIGR01451 family)